MKASDLRDRSTEDLKELERSLADERFQNQFKNFTNRLDDTSLIRKSRRDLARVKQILTERARGIEVVAKPKAAPAKKAAEPKAEKPAKKKAPRAEATGEANHAHAEAGAEHAHKPAKKAHAAHAEGEAPAKEKRAKSKPKSTEKTESK